MRNPAKRAVFLDRDGVINQLVYLPEHGVADSPSQPSQFRLTEGAGESLARLKALGYELILVSNQPGVAKGHFSMKSFHAINNTMERKLRRYGVELDGQYYCLHHPSAVWAQYRRNCACRKPKPGLILRGAREHSISLKRSFMIGDGLRDVKAGRAAGCTTILLGSASSFLTKLMKEQDAFPDFLAGDLSEAVGIIKRLGPALEGLEETDCLD